MLKKSARLTATDTRTSRPLSSLAGALAGTAAFCALLSSTAAGQGCSLPGPTGCWEGPWDWTCQLPVDPTSGGNIEFSHAALIPKGPYQGRVLLWHLNLDAHGGAPTTESWIFDPADPARLRHVTNSAITTSIFCAGMTWDQDGHLLVAGGGGALLPSEAYRFFPTALQWPPVYVSGQCNPMLILGDAWRANDDMAHGVWYPTLVTLAKGLIHASPFADIPGGSSMVLGGSVGGAVSSGGNPWWQIMPKYQSSPTPTWSHVFYNNTDITMTPQSGGEVYDLKSETAFLPTTLIDSYPRALQLATIGSAPNEFVKNLFITGDIDNAGGAPPLPGTEGDSWIVRLRYDAAQAATELWRGMNAGDPTDPSNPRDRFYGSAVLMHMSTANLPHSDGLNRVLLFGGAQYVDPTGGTNKSWQVTSEVQEFKPGSDPAKAANGAAWITKATGLIKSRIYNNAVVLPTGEIFIGGGADAIGGTSTGFPAVSTIASGPEIYHPGEAGGPLGASSSQMASPVPVTARLYHNMALLLPDGRLFAVGGEKETGFEVPDPRWNGEIFSPPYLGYGFRPTILSTSSDNLAFAADFQITVQRDATHTIDRIVLLRPAAVTHNFDTDQRYIELDFTSTGVDDNLESFNVTAPADDLGPPGYYMLFVIENDGSATPLRAPSVAHFMKLS